MKEINIVGIGERKIGGKNPILVQSMTNTDTADFQKTSEQIIELAKSGAEIVRITIDRPESALAVPYILEKVRPESSVPIVGDFHFSGHLLLEKFPKMAESLDKYRINPGNLGGKNRDVNFEKILTIAEKYKKPIRIGGNSGSIDPILLAEKEKKNQGKPFKNIEREALVQSVLNSEKWAKRFLPPSQIVLSAKCSGFSDTVFVYKKIAQKSNSPLHIGLTEAGGGISGIIKSTSALAVLLESGIGNTIRVSITPQKGESRSREIEIAREILQSVEMRQFFPEIISCPGCGRASAEFSLFAEKITKHLRSPLLLEKFPHLGMLKIAIMGCIVNGPGEAKKADMGFFFPGREEKKAVIFVRGKKVKECEREKILENFPQFFETLSSDLFLE